MTVRIHARPALGILALAGMLCLASPGVEVARADPSPAAPGVAERLAAAAAEEPGMCTEDDASLRRAAAAAHVRERLRAEMERGDGADVVVLNTRGYNYRLADPRAELAAVEAEAAQQARGQGVR